MTAIAALAAAFAILTSPLHHNVDHWPKPPPAVHHHHHHRRHHHHGRLFPVWWLRQALCIHRTEAAWHEKSNPGYRGGMQFGWGTWSKTISMHVQLIRLRLPRDPADATIRSQLRVAWFRYHDESSPWSDWLPYDHAYYCVR